MNKTSYLNRILAFVFATALLTAVSSCCGECMDEKLRRIYFEGFNSGETDTLLLKSFSKNSKFTAPIDSFLFYDTQVSTMRYLPRDLESQYDWKITLISTQEIFQLTDIEYINGKDNKNGCSSCKHIDSYKINGNEETERGFTIKK